jgi:formylglycine-generating enzyme required for sulfatase activity
VKPDNIYLTNRGQVILLDFGAARYAMNAQSRGYSIIGTEGYMPFEQYQRKGHQGPWTDIYACGATLYALLTGTRPPDAPDRMDYDEMVAPNRLAPGISAGVNDAVVQALRMEIRDRPQDIQQYMKLFRTEPEPREEWVEHATGMVFVWVPGGCYMMGCGDWDGEGLDDEKPVHEVCVDGFWMGQTAVTQGQWQRVMGSNPSYFKKGDNYPVEQVSWEDAKEYIRKLNGMGNAKFRLPSEAEWEYAARSGGKAEKYSGGSALDSVAWYSSNSGGSTHPVRTKKDNGLGIYDMSGNVWEWCEAVYTIDTYSQSDKKNPIYDSGGFRRVTRGGSYRGEPFDVRCAGRASSDPADRGDSLGFRLLRMP